MPSAAQETINIERACEHLYCSHWGRLLQYARAKGCDEQDAEDVVQDLFLRLIRLGLLVKLCHEPDSVQTSHLMRTLHSMIMNRWRYRVAMRRGGGKAADSIDVMNEAGHEIPMERCPVAELQRAWAMSVLERCTLELRDETPSERWRTLEPVLFDMEPQADAAVQRDGALRVAAFRARQKFRELLTRESGFGLDARHAFFALRDALAGS